MSKVLFSFLLVVWASFSHVYAQDVTIIGKVVDLGTKEPLTGITVLLKDSNNKIIAFKASNSQGEINIVTKKDISSAYLEINHLGYKKKKIDIISIGQVNIIAMEVSSILLEDVEIKSRPKIQQYGDTLSYDVSSFAKDEDRAIGDVLKRMPGIEVSESGQIKYQGKAISNFYIDGDDLLGDKYKIGTNTIAHNMVKDVQVLNNHEHMKVLKNKRYTDEVAINLVIKEDAKLSLSGQAKLGLGFPKQFDVEGNTVLFNKKYKGLNVLQGNNVGKDIAADIIGYNSSSVLTKLGMSPINNLLSLGVVGSPPLSKQHYLFNNSAGINANNLFNLKSKWQLVSNIQAVFDESKRDFAGRTTYFSENNNYSFSENQKSDTRKWVSAIALKATKNEEHQYVENSFSFEYENELSTATINTNDLIYSLRKKHQISGFKNKLDYVPVLKNGDIIQFGWLVNYGSKPQNLQVNPGIFSSILNDGIPYDATIQQLEVPSLFSNISAGYRIPRGKIKQYYGVNIAVDDQKLKSYIEKESNDIRSTIYQDSTNNDMHWLRTSIAIEGKYEYKKNRFASMLSLPLAYQTTMYKDPLYALDKRENKVLFNPSFSAQYFLNAESQFAFSYARGNSFGNIENVYRGLIIRNYRSISNNSSGINESRSNNFNLNYKTGKSLKLLFYNIGLTYNKSISSTLLSNRISEEVSQTELIQQENAVQSYGVNAGFDKYLFGLASTLKLNGSINWTDYNQLFNDELLPFQNVSYTISPSLDLKIWRKLNLSYNGNIGLTNTRQIEGMGDLNRTAVNMSQNVGFPFTIFSGFHINMSARHLFSHQEGLKDINYVFMDTFVRYRFKKWKTDFEFNLSNLGNIKRFDMYTISANMEAQNSYQLRGRMGILKMVMNF